MKHHLVVIEAFAGHAKGARIEDPSEVAAILASEHAGHVNKIAAPAAPAKKSDKDKPE
jgi:hypothetical protein